MADRSTEDEDKKTWYFLIDRGDNPSSYARLTQSWIADGEILFSFLVPNAGWNCLLRCET